MPDTNMFANQSELGFVPHINHGIACLMLIAYIGKCFLFFRSNMRRRT